MSRRTICIALLSALAFAGCDSSQNRADKAPATQPEPPASPKATQPDTPAPAPAPVPTRADSTSAQPFAALQADPGKHAGAHLWSRRIGSDDQDSVRTVAIDAAGNVAVAGHYSTGADFGDGKAVEAQKVDAFVALYDPEGRLLWVIHFGGPGEDTGNAVTFDTQGNVLVAGLFTGEIMVGSQKLVGQGSDDAFVAKIGRDGTTVWARRFGGLDSDAAHDVVAGPGGDIFLTGSFKGKVLAAEDLRLESKGNEDIFVMRLDAAGDLVWLKQFGARWRDFGQRLALDRRGDLVLLTVFTGEVSFGGEILKPEGNQDVAVVKLNSNGEHIWSRRFGSHFNELGLGLAVDLAGNIAISGSFDNEITFGGDKLVGKGESDVFVARFDPEGKHLWSRAFGSVREDIGYGVGVDKYGNITVGGWFWGTVDFGGGPLQAKGQNKDAFLLKLSASGEHIWSKRFGGQDHDQTRGVAVNEDGRAAVAGIFRFALDLGGPPLQAVSKPGDKAPPADVFVAVFGP